MYNLTKETLRLSEIAACIASDNFYLLERKVLQYRKHSFVPLKLYELILQSYLFCGFPATIESLRIFGEIFSDFKNVKTQYNVKEFKKSGINNCKLIYKKNYKKLIENMDALSSELKEWMLIEGYGKVLSRPGLDLRERELMNVSFLCTHYYETQLHSHIRGCLNLNIPKIIVNILLDNLKSISGKKNISNAKKLLTRIALK